MDSVSSVYTRQFRQIVKVAGAVFLQLGLTHCGTTQGDSDPFAVREDTSWYGSRLSTTESSPAGMNPGLLENQLDVRGVGDSGVNLSRLSQTTGYWKGDLAFMNFESVVTENCRRKNPGVDFFFQSQPSQVKFAYEQGFNLFSLANNHSRDCFQPYGPTATELEMNKLAAGLDLLWHGTSAQEPYEARIKTFRIKGRDLKVAFAAVSIQSWSMAGVAQIVYGSEGVDKPEIKQLLASLQKADVDFRILSIHTQDGSGNGRREGTAFKKLKQLSELFITSYNGNLVFGHGPHTQAGVKVIERLDGRKGVIFTSLGNFLHPGLSGHGDNYLGRAVFNWEEDLQLNTVQVFPLANRPGPRIQFTRPASAPLANFKWRKGSSSFYATFE